MTSTTTTSPITAIDKLSVHRITSGQVVIDLQTAVKELVENSLDAGATNIEVRFKDHGLKSIEVVDNGCGIAPEDYDSVALKHHTSKLATFTDLSAVLTYGFRGEALSSLCALCQDVVVTTARSEEVPAGVALEMGSDGRVRKRGKVARQRGTTVNLTNLFKPLPVRRKEFERNVKREFGKALSLLNAYALVPCTKENKGVRLTVSNQMDGGRKTIHLRSDGTPSIRASVSSLWGPKALDNIVDLDLTLNVEAEKSVMKRMANIEGFAIPDGNTTKVHVRGLISKFAIGCGKTGTDRQFFFVNGRPCNLSKIQKVFNEVYRSFNANQSPFIIVDLIIPTDAYDVNVSPDKRTIFLHNEANLITELKASLEESFAPSRAVYETGGSQFQTQLSRQGSGIDRSTNRDKAALQVVDVEDQADSSRASASNIDVEMSDLIEKPPATDGDRSSDLDADIAETSSPVRPLVASYQVSDGDITHQTANAVIKEALSARPIVDMQETETSDTIQDDLMIEPSSTSSSIGTTNPTKQSNSRDLAEVVLSTTRAAWNRNLERRDEGPPKKKRRLNMDLEETLDDETEKVSAAEQAKQNWKSRLSSFARSGSQPSQEIDMRQDDSDQDGAVEDEQDELDELTEDKDLDQDDSNPNRDLPSEHEQVIPDVARPNVIDLTDKLRESDSEVDPIAPSSQDIPRSEVIRNSINGDVSLRFFLARVSTAWHALRDCRARGSQEPQRQSASTISTDASISNAEDDNKAQDALARIIDKGDFASMEIVGQFNLGFIVTRRRKSSPEHDGSAPTHIMDDLFIVDQHAADEKYNFETLQQTTVIKSQKLFQPEPLELTAGDELIALENIDLLRQNGFEIDVEDGGVESGRVLKLVAQPVSKSTVFDMRDLEELIHLMEDRPNGQMVRCSKARAMFAMRACRKSVMVGMPLTKKQMASVVQHMGTMDQPWNCPHGRPTMRHLSGTNPVPRNERKINWSTYNI